MKVKALLGTLKAEGVELRNVGGALVYPPDTPRGIRNTIEANRDALLEALSVTPLPIDPPGGTAHNSSSAKSEPSENLQLRVAELIIRYEIGHFDERVRARLAEIFRDDPPDAWDRLERACDHLEISGARVLDFYPSDEGPP